MKILVIDDDPAICQLLKKVVEEIGWQVTLAIDGLEGIKEIKKDKYDLVFLDLNLPYKSGDSILIELRKFSNVPVIIISAKELVSTKVDLLKLGADDYITKPFDIDELVARAEAVFRREASSKKMENTILQHQQLKMDLEAKSVSLNNQQIQLTNKEFLILQLFMKHPNKVFSKQNIFESVWGENYYDDWHTVNVHINSLRVKLSKADPEKDYIQTLWNVGYRLAKEVEN
ncbi:response regulator transcription factor [Enterococcus hulanensis]|uniref:response regulator transcription factor n=1 Tax=Enterococcus hulanensis TaxID=2559929 RepID=UPI001A92F6CD|nr:response regulator transcription factor [Enterococcus hulanensis]MBO0410166.1 response regulator transcription factor [Enterococcus hulanensis]